jgi:hypothetical protein
MNQNLVPLPTNKKQYVTDIGKILVAENGKKKYYKPEEVKKAHQKSSWIDVVDFSCWAMSTFSSHSDFDKYHLEKGEVCSYVDMKSEMLSSFSGSTSSSWSEIPDLDIDDSWLDFGTLFEVIGDFLREV